MKVTIDDGSKNNREINLTFTGITLGSGACGAVREAKLSDTGEKVAVKTLDARESAEEVKYLKTLKHSNIIKMLCHFAKFDQRLILFHEYIVMERMPNSLSRFYNVAHTLSRLEIKLYMYQLLRSLAYMHNQGICHRDIKPGNLLIDPQTCVLKLCDFGISTNLSLKCWNSCTIGSRRYHSPEQLLRFLNYSNSVDVWAVGYILVELLNGQKELFYKQRTRADQLVKMIDVFGTPVSQDFQGLLPKYPFERLPQREAKPWSEIITFRPVSDDAISLCSGLLCYSPSSRLLPHEALAHEFFDELRSPETTRLANGNPLPPLFNFQPGEFPGGFDHLIPSHINSTEVESGIN